MKTLYILLLFLIIFHAVALSQDIPEGSICAECGMKVDPGSRFSALVIDREDNRKYFFCDIGDMLYHYRKSPERIKEVNVRDFISGIWIDGRAAYYVRNKEFKTPMSWQIGAFRNRTEAERFGKIYTFQEAFELIK
ncbi:MAG: nitrous oxide reductase accessory protein NosL [Thermodesulfovibrionales bacterium]